MQIMTDTLTVFGNTFTGVTGIKASDNNSQIKTYVRPQGTLSITQNGTGIDVTNYAAVDVSVSGGGGFDINEIADGTANYGDLVFTGTKIRPYFFSKNLTLTSFTGNNVVSMRGTEFSTTNYSYAFADCTNLTSVSMPNLAVLGSSDYCFAGCTNLESLNIDYFNLETWTTGALQNCSKLTKEYYVMPCLAGGIWSNALTNNPYIKGIDVGGKAPISSGSWKINTGAFTNNSNLNIIVIRTSETMALANINALNGTKFASGNAGGTLYVPQSKITDYQSASNWSTILGYANNQIKSIESTHTDPDAPVDLTEYYLDGSHATERSITPCVYDYRKGYVDNNTWKYQDPTDTLCDIYLVCASVEYKISLGSVVGTRFRAMFTDKDVTQTTSNVTGTNIINQNNPAANASVTYTPNKSGYIIVAKDNVGTTGL